MGLQKIQEVFKSDKSAGMLLIGCTIVSLLLANSSVADAYGGFWESGFAGHGLTHWINDGLMAVFFLLVGLELKRELRFGTLSNTKRALFPLFGALGGMLFPAGFYLLFNSGTATQSGAGIPMATDIAFALGVLSLLGSKVPTSLKVFLTALAVIDDLGAILVIAIGYSKGLDCNFLVASLSVFGLLLILNRIGIRNLIPYLLGGVAMWYLMLHSGVHATITGVLLAFAIPLGKGGHDSAAGVLEHSLHLPVTYFILPVFALANTAIVLSGSFSDVLTQNYSLGIAAGLVIGKPTGIFIATFIAVQCGLCKLPAGLNWKNILGAGFLGGIGFTMSIFIALLAFDDHSIIDNAKLVVLLSSLTAGLLGLLAVNYSFRYSGKR